MSFLKPLHITDTHVVVNVLHLSAFGLVLALSFMKRLFNTKKPINGQVLLFLQPPQSETQKLGVFFLPRNVHVSEVTKQHPDAEYIPATSNCKFIGDKIYSVLCHEAIFIQPDKEVFDLECGSNCPPTFEVHLPTNKDEVTLTVQDQRKTEVWKYKVDLKAPRRKYLERRAEVLVQQTRSGPAVTPNVPADEKLLSVRTEFIDRVSEPNLNTLLSKLLEQGIITDGEMESAGKPNRAEKAEALIDMVRRKGPEASSALIAALCEVDPVVSKQLKLR